MAEPNAGLSRGFPMVVITNIGTMGFDDSTKEICLLGLWDMPGDVLMAPSNTSTYNGEKNHGTNCPPTL
ncbi:hypothetical protein [Desulforapulum autotrophicum]|uniref:hypothetical protein n=1 Tax=Desulforapulum autotrophicum TaxID=2296 RepID=UPI0002D4F827|nr:hypothetical protein [Desulforapulum autotrophicum]